MKQKISLGLRGSQLSLAQGELVVDALREHAPEVLAVIEPFAVAGDRKRDLGDAVERDKRDWIQEIEQAIIDGQLDIAIHSGKDVPVDVDERTTIIPLLARASAHDVLLTRKGILEGRRSEFQDIPQGGVIGTSSLRRKAQLLRVRQDLLIKTFRGNIPTRIEKLKKQAGTDAIVIAAAGLERLGFLDQVPLALSTEQSVPAVNQGMLVVQLLRSREDLITLIQPLVVPTTQSAFDAERAFIQTIGADCRSAVGIYAEPIGEELLITARVLSTDGRACLEEKLKGSIHAARELGNKAGKVLLDKGARDLLRS